MGVYDVENQIVPENVAANYCGPKEVETHTYILRVMENLFTKYGHPNWLLVQVNVGSIWPSFVALKDS